MGVILEGEETIEQLLQQILFSGDFPEQQVTIKREETGLEGTRNSWVQAGSPEVGRGPNLMITSKCSSAGTGTGIGVCDSISSEFLPASGGEGGWAGEQCKDSPARMISPCLDLMRALVWGWAKLIETQAGWRSSNTNGLLHFKIILNA